MEVDNPQNKISNSEPVYYIALDEKDNEYTIKLDIDNAHLIFEIINEDDINFIDKKYISKNSYDFLKKNHKIFSDYNSLEEIKKFMEDNISKEENILACKLKKENNKYILTIPVSFENIKFDLIEQEKDIKALIKQLLIDNKKKTEEIIKIKKEISLTKELLNNLNNEMNIFHGDGTFYICSALNPKKCIDIKPLNDHWYLIINDFNADRITQKFQVKIMENAQDHCIKNFYDNKIVSVYNANTENGSKILMDENVNYNDNQLWLFVKYGEYVCIRYKKNCGKVIDIPNENLNNGNELNIWGFNGNMNQKWKFIKAE